MSGEAWAAQVANRLRRVCELNREYHEACRSPSGEEKKTALGEAWQQARLALLLYMVEYPAPEGAEKAVRERPHELGNGRARRPLKRLEDSAFI